MKLIKQNGVEFEPYYRTLPNLADNTEYSASRDYADTYKLGSILNKYTHFIESMHSLEEDLKNLNSLDEFSGVFAAGLKRVINLKTAEVYLYNENQPFLMPLIQNGSDEVSVIVKQIETNGILNAIFSTQETTIIPESSEYTKEDARLNYLVYPVFESRKRKGIVIIQTALTSFSKRSIEAQFIKIVVERFMSKISFLQQKMEMKETYNELQAYQSKFKNEYKLSAVGELTSEIVENILEPLQAIVSSTDILMNESKDESPQLLEIIKHKSKIIETSIKRISRFSSKNVQKENFVSCDLNEIIREFFLIIESNFAKKNYECLLDLDEQLPTLLSKPDYLKQVITNIFIMLNSSLKNAGGIWIQTRHEKENVLLKVFCSDYVAELSTKGTKEYSNNYLRIISGLVKKHAGSISYDSQKLMGTSITISFPLRGNL